MSKKKNAGFKTYPLYRVTISTFEPLHPRMEFYLIAGSAGEAEEKAIVLGRHHAVAEPTEISLIEFLGYVYL